MQLFFGLILLLISQATLLFLLYAKRWFLVFLPLGVKLLLIHLMKFFSTQGRCLFKTSNNSIGDIYVSRSGTCDQNTTYNPSTGECEAPQTDPCEAKAGQTSQHEHQIGTLDNPDAPHVASSRHCLRQQVPTCPFPVLLQKTVTVLSMAQSPMPPFVSMSTNSMASVAPMPTPVPPDIFDQPPTKPPIDQKPLLTNATNCDDWVTNADGSRTRNCTANETFKQPGTMNCSTSGTALKCTAGTPPPAYSDKDTTQQTTEKTNPEWQYLDQHNYHHRQKPPATELSPANPPVRLKPTLAAPSLMALLLILRIPALVTTAPKMTLTRTPQRILQMRKRRAVLFLVKVLALLPLPVLVMLSSAPFFALKKNRNAPLKNFRILTRASLKSGVHSDLSGPDFEKGDVDSISFDSVLDTSSTIGGSCPALPEIVVTLAGQSKSMDFDTGLSELCRYASLFSFLLVAFAMWAWRRNCRWRYEVMQIVIQLFFRLLAWAIVPLGWKLLKGLGFAAVTFTGIQLFMDEAKSFVFTQLMSLPVEWVNLIGLLKLDVCLNIYFSAYIARAVLWGMDRSTGSKSSISYKG